MKEEANKIPFHAQDRVQPVGEVPATPQDYLNEIRVDKSTQPRVIVTTDGECDDQNSLRHMLLYANDMDIAGLIYSAAQFHFQGDGVHTLKEITPHFRCQEEGAGDLMSFRAMEVDEDGHGVIMANYHLMNDGAYFPNDPDNMQYGRLTVIDWGFVVMQRETYDFMGEGDSIHWIPMISVGLRGLESPESFNYGSWAGRFTWQTVSGKMLHQPDWDREYDYVMGRAGGTTTWDGNYDGFSGKRFGEQFFHDWVGRAGWTVNGFETANHPPMVRVE